MKEKKVVLAYSGGLDTSVAIKWLQEKYGVQVIALSVDVGQQKNLKEVQKKAMKLKAAKAEIIDAQREFAHDYVLPALKANALYEGKYPLATALARPLIAKWLVKQAKKYKATYVAHGCTAKGNDQVRFDVSIAALAPTLRIIAPHREWRMSRKGEIEYAKAHKIPVTVTKEDSYSIDENLWGRSVECGVLEDPWQEPPASVFEWTQEPEKSPAVPAYVEIYFEKGLPVKVDGRKLELHKLIAKLNKIGSTYGVGRIDQVENRLVGIKSREIYECPAATILIAAHRELEALTLPREVLHYKYVMEQKYAELVYYGLWYDPLKEALDSFINSTQKNVTGTVKMKLYKGSAQVAGRKSKRSLYDLALATYEEGDKFSHDAAKGFIKLWGLPLEVWAKKQK